MIPEIKPLEKTFAPITVVSMCFNMGMKSLSSVKEDQRTNYKEYYVKSADKLCELFSNVILFCDEECASYIKLRHPKVYTVVMKFDDLPKMGYYDEWCLIFERMINHVKFNKKMKCPIKHRRNSAILHGEAGAIAKYTVLNNSKIDLMLEAKKQNPYKTEYFYWFDCGCLLRDDTAGIWDKWDGTIMHRPEGFRCALAMEKWNWFQMKFLWTRHNLAYVWPPANQISGACLGCKGDLLDEFQKLYDQTIESYMKKGLMSSEQSIIPYMIKKYTKLFDIPKNTFGYKQVFYEVANGEKLY